MIESHYFRPGREPIRTYLVCRLKQPIVWGVPSDLPAPSEIIAGARFTVSKERISQDSWDILRLLFSFDYMGSSEFEWGSVPYALRRMHAEKEDYHVMEVILDPAKIKTTGFYWSSQKRRTVPPAQIWALCRRNHDGHARNLIEALAYDEKTERSFKEAANFAGSLLHEEKHSSSQIIAWLDISNGIFWSYQQDLTAAVAQFLCKVTSP